MNDKKRITVTVGKELTKKTQNVVYSEPLLERIERLESRILVLEEQIKAKDDERKVSQNMNVGRDAVEAPSN